ncbi:MAG: hemerythrin domain-containing protein [Nitrospirae bacterium]|nr:hemerythrin domain-containing protein [Candidatus Manganitrophaceae bacterium]
MKEKQSKKSDSIVQNTQNTMEWVGEVFRGFKEDVRSAFVSEGKMKATELLKQDHDKVKGLIEQLKSARKNKRALIRQIEEEIKIHSRCEEMIFYPEMKKVNSELIAESLEEHHQVDMILAELKKMTGKEGEAFDAKVIVFEETLQHHIDEEEGEMFPEAEKKLKDQLESLGEEIVYFKGELKAKRKKAA